MTDLRSAPVRDPLQDSAARRVPRRNLARLYALEARHELLKNLRTPLFALSTLLFPWMFYAFFGLAFDPPGGGGDTVARYLLATYGAFGAIGASLFGFGVGVAVERGQGWMRVKRASPMPAAAYLVAKIVMAAAFGLLIVLGLVVLAVAFGGVDLTPRAALSLLGVLVFGTLPFCAIGLALGAWIHPNAAAPVVNLVYLPTAFLGGLWIPVEQLPGLVQGIAPWLPTYRFGQLALMAVGVPSGTGWAWHAVYLVLATVVFGAVAAVGLRRAEERGAA